jgi:hypothetical protein
MSEPNFRLSRLIAAPASVGDAGPGPESAP